MCLALPGKILTITTPDNNPLNRMARIDFSGIRKDISLAYLPEAIVDDYVIVHAGLALSIVDAHEAQLTLQAFQDLESFEATL